MDGRMRAVQTNKQQMEQTELRVDAERPPRKPRAGQSPREKEKEKLFVRDGKRPKRMTAREKSSHPYARKRECILTLLWNATMMQASNGNTPSTAVLLRAGGENDGSNGRSSKAELNAEIARVQSVLLLKKQQQQQRKHGGGGPSSSSSSAAMGPDVGEAREAKKMTLDLRKQIENFRLQPTKQDDDEELSVIEYHHREEENDNPENDAPDNDDASEYEEVTCSNGDEEDPVTIQEEKVSVVSAKEEQERREQEELQNEIKRIQAALEAKKKKRQQVVRRSKSNDSSSGMPMQQNHRKQANFKSSQSAAVRSTVSSEAKQDRQQQQMEDGISKMEAAIIEQATASPTTPATTNVFGGGGKFDLMASIAKAAESREKRLEETGGELVMKEVKPEVAAPKQSAPQLAFSMAEMVTQKARAREKRLEEGGEKKMTKVKDKSEYKKQFSNICMDAASMGRLTRLEEHTVEAVAGEKTKEEEWRSSGLLAIQWRSNHMSVIHEAAQLGEQCKLPEHVVSNCEEVEEEEWDPNASEKPMSPRLRQLLDLETKVGEGLHKVDKLVSVGREEKAGDQSLLIKPMQTYKNIEEIQLPRKAPPKIDPEKARERLSRMRAEAVAGKRPMKDIGLEVAERAWERRSRLDRPGSMPKVQQQCDCPYCINPSPYQTHAYRVKAKQEKKERLQREIQRLEEAERRRKEAAERKNRESPPPQPVKEPAAPAEEPAESGQGHAVSAPESVVSRGADSSKFVTAEQSSHPQDQPQAQNDYSSNQRLPSQEAAKAQAAAVDAGCACVIL
jgi:hypothetical protein